MKYEEAIKLLAPGDLIAVSHQTWASVADIESQIVRMVTESEYSHVCVVLDNDGICPRVLEAVVPSVTVSPLSKYLKDGFFWIATPDKPMSEQEKGYGLSKFGQPYSKLEAVEGYLKWLDIGEDTKWQCSELTIRMRALSNLALGDTATPAAVVRQALKHGYTLQFISKG